MKRGRLSKAEKFYLEHNKDKSVQELAEDLNRSENAVREHLNLKPAASTSKAKRRKRKGDPVKKAGFAKSDETRGVVTSTESASERADETLKASPSSKYNRSIFKPLGKNADHY